MENRDAGLVLESRLARPYFVPIALVVSVGLLALAWWAMTVTGVPTDEMGLVAIVFVVMGAFTLGVAGLWAWMGLRARVKVTQDRLIVDPVLARKQSVSLATLAVVDLDKRGEKAQLLTLVDRGRDKAEVGIASWERQNEILSLVADAARRANATVTPAAREVIRQHVPGARLE